MFYINSVMKQKAIVRHETKNDRATQMRKREKSVRKQHDSRAVDTPVDGRNPTAMESYGTDMMMVLPGALALVRAEGALDAGPECSATPPLSTKS